MEHHELVNEMTYIEKLSTQERLKLARRRRLQQLKKYSQRDKDSLNSKKEKTAFNEAKKISDFKSYKKSKVYFTSNVMILEAAARNDIDEVKEFLENGVDPDSTNEDGLTALHQCCIDDSEEMMRLLVYYGANVNAQDSEKWTPLHAAATCGHLHLAKFLISKGANLLAVNADGNMPYDICEDDTTLDYIENEMAARGVTQQLIDDTRATTERKMLAELKKMKLEGRSLLCRDEVGATPLHIAAANGYIYVVEYLLKQNIPVEVQDSDDWSPLHAAACWGHPDVLELLVQHGANLQAKTKNQETPYDICEDAELRERIMQLVNEQETKRLNDQHKRVRRVRSNKRTQSIRRTSIREKVLTHKKDAQEEARFRRQLDDQYFVVTNNLDVSSENVPSNDDSVDPLSLDIVNNLESNSKDDLLRSKEIIQEVTSDEEQASNAIRVDESSKKSLDVTDGLKEEKSNLNNEVEYHVDLAPTGGSVRGAAIGPPSSSHPAVNRVQVSFSSTESEKRRKPAPPIPPPRSSSTLSSTSSLIPTVSTNTTTTTTTPTAVIDSPNDASPNGKIDIHVTVTVNPFSPGTLQDLKRQRAMSRATTTTQNTVPLPTDCETSNLLSSNSATFSPGLERAAQTTSLVSAPSSADSPVRPPSCISYGSHPSPSQMPRRFYSQPNDVIGKDRVPCCGLM